MARSLHSAKTKSPRFWAFAISSVLLLGPLLFAAPAQRVHFSPKFTPGEVLRYQVDLRTVSTGKTTTPIANPEGETKVSQTISLLVRLEVLGVPTPGPAPAQERFRATYETSRAQSESDAFNPDIPSLEDQYAKLDGRTLEFTVMADGRITEIRGLEDIFPHRSETDPILSWVQSLWTGNRIPEEGIVIAQKWNSERALPGGPLNDLYWRAESTYLRDDPCGSMAGIEGTERRTRKPDDMCALLLTHFEISRRGSPQSDATPEEFRRNGLRTSGTWSGSGESLDSISLTTGLLESSTQTSTQEMDYDIGSASKGSRIRQVGELQSQSEIRLVSAITAVP